MIKAKNNSGNSSVWCGQTIAAAEYYEIQTGELFKWQNDSAVLSDIGSGNLIINNGSNDIASVADAINYLKGIDSSPRDTDGSLIMRAKAAKAGWHFEPHAVTLKTSKHGASGFYNKDIAGNDLGFVTCKIYDSNNAEITDAANEANSTKSVWTWEPNHDMEIIGARLFQSSAPTTDLFLYVVAVPDVAAQYGGSVKFSNGGINLKLAGIGGGVTADGRVSKYLSYNATYHTTKFQITLKHDAGLAHEIMFLFELFKA